ncbi:TlpA family protein disulfide reductase [Salinibacter ruber]|uniref:Thiol-disulfide isomerase/thioredoxin n=1 Tax=Salinibacter ruber TaxID=146919 RepID=A0A9X2U2B9_9BACT|nr:TlpA disulfide reductase family protein [Salinibacter ruber]MCS3858372.1 thiol-disulfide isomerase/thioredoxin [Salinibacter ruber]MCS3865199.1 thiol-disulfide isomerase/thioredoxin [Salinibacter ruber]MCS4149726.1 thiol-disulfide isomerase/thioredoxin [Salinibacter ruber]MCS4175872.1 thiol-disulfide isomerase/thioredoxin [Salinibacter ruber]
MRRLLTLACTVGLLVLLTACGGDDTAETSDQAAPSASASRGPIPGKVRDVGPEPVPTLTLETLDGASIDLAARDGELLLVNFWATWCAPCREEIPDLKSLHTDFENLTVIGIALDRKGREVVKPFAQKLEINYPIVIDKSGAAEAEFGPIPGLPTTVLVTPDGQVTKRVVGIFPTEEMRPTLKKMLSGEA